MLIGDREEKLREILDWIVGMSTDAPVTNMARRAVEMMDEARVEGEKLNESLFPCNAAIPKDRKELLWHLWDKAEAATNTAIGKLNHFANAVVAYEALKQRNADQRASDESQT